MSPVSGLKNMISHEVVLASASPRRHALLKGLDIPCKVIVPVDIPEIFPESLAFRDIPEYLAKAKADANMHHINENQVLLTADTVVLLGNRLIQKPANREEAVEMLTALSGKEHAVLTGVCLRSSQKEICFTSETLVRFSPLSTQEINYYLDAYKPYDKAGAYGIQEWIGYVAIEHIEGSFYNVMGLPIHQVYSSLKAFNNK